MPRCVGVDTKYSQHACVSRCRPSVASFQLRLFDCYEHVNHRMGPARALARAACAPLRSAPKAQPFPMPLPPPPCFPAGKMSPKGQRWGGLSADPSIRSADEGKPG